MQSIHNGRELTVNVLNFTFHIVLYHRDKAVFYAYWNKDRLDWPDACLCRAGWTLDNFKTNLWEGLSDLVCEKWYKLYTSQPTYTDAWRHGEMLWWSIIHSKWLQLKFSQWIVLLCCVHRTADIVNHLIFVFYFSVLELVLVKGLLR